MNVDTGLIKMLAAGAERDTELLKALMDDGFRMIPEGLQEEAKKELNGKSETYLNLKGNSPLARWAKHQRKEDKKKVKRKQAKASRKLNR